MNIAMFLQMAAETCPDRVALTSHHEQYRYPELYQAAQVAAGRFRASGCRYVSVVDTSSAAVPIALFGAALAGMPYVPLNYRLTRAELDELMQRISPVYLIADDHNLQAYDTAPAVTVSSRDEFLRQTLGNEPEDQDWLDDPSAVAIQLFTSGTTGKPKAAILRHEHLVSYILGSVEFMSAEEPEATLVSVPPYHIAGISAVMSSI